MSALVEQIEAEARARFVHWDASLWAVFVDGPAHALAASLTEAEAPLLLSYLRLVAEGIGRGYVVPEGSGAVTFAMQALSKLVPEGLANVPAGRRAQTLAMVWNLAENLSNGPAWLERLFTRAFVKGPLVDLEARVAEVERAVFEAPAERLDAPARASWTHLGTEDRRFLPGAMHWLAPTVLCVHDRLRTDLRGAPVSQGIYLGGETPLPLGPLRCAESLEGAASTGESLWPPRGDDRWSPPCFTTRNEYRAAAALRFSQFVVTMSP